jgi:cytochrome c
MRRALLLLLGCLCFGGCHGSRYVLPYGVDMPGDPASGLRVVEARHCGVCHDISAVTGAAGVIGPSLDHFAVRSFIAGALPNTPPNLIAWIRSPQTIDPRAAMPTLGLDEHELRNVAAYLYTLR